jgi:glycosyltransferase involved in cell wall biosynthesis
MFIYYWCPFLTKIATIKSVINSVSSFKKYNLSNIKINPIIINSCGEWDDELTKKNLNSIKLNKFSFHKILPKKGFMSRLSLLTISIINFLPLLFLIRKNKPDYIIIHLLTALPIILSAFWGSKTKIILRISGLPRLNFLRRSLWKLFRNKIYLVTTPTNLTRKSLIKKNIFDEKKIKILRDPIINCKNINELKKEELNKEFNFGKYYIALGRLTNQKNFTFLIDSFSKIHDELKIKNLIILGEGEQRVLLENLIKRYKMEKYIHLIGYKNNPYKYIHNSEALISTSNYEDPGFVIYESIFLNKAIISSNCDNGPKELSESVKKGFFFSKR